ncbi:MAG TPA: DinB family protein [Mycobacteriales bacterium]|nr:DinB family protein [Mycobacteriales bacterium]
MTITPDTKDWTWVIERRCPECGFDPLTIDRTQVGRLVAQNAATWADLLRGAAEIRRRPKPDVWSTAEYGCHVRDVYRLFLERLDLMLTEDAPRFANWDQDETAIANRYSEQDPATVAAELVAAAAPLADRFNGVSGAEWDRTGNRSDGSHFTVDTFARYLLHDLVHHVYDVTGTPAR